MSTRPRTAPIKRITTETQITGKLNIDGRGVTEIKTPIGLLSHMLQLFSFHGFFDIELKVTGDTHIDIHHTNEDIGIALGKAFKEALKEKKSIKRFGSGFAPMEDTLGHTVIDISGRGHHKINYIGLAITSGMDKRPMLKEEEGYSYHHLDHFIESFAKQIGANIIITINNPNESADLHTVMETVFKSLGLALDQATTVDPRRTGVPSTKGIID